MKKKIFLRGLIGLLFVFVLVFSFSFSCLADLDSSTTLTYGTALSLIAGNSDANNIMTTIRGYNYWAIFLRGTTIPDSGGYAITYLQAIASNDPLIMVNTDTLVCGAEVPHVFCYFAFSWNPYGPYWYFSNTNHKNMTPDSSTRWKNVGSSEEYVTPSYTGTWSNFEPCPGDNYILQEKKGNIIYYPTLNDLYNNTNGESYPPYEYFTGDYWDYTLENQVLTPPETLGDAFGVRVDSGNYENGKIRIGGSDSTADIDFSYVTDVLNVIKESSYNPPDLTVTLPQAIGGYELTLIDVDSWKEVSTESPIFRVSIRLFLYVNLVLFAWWLFAKFFNAGEVAGGVG